MINDDSPLFINYGWRFEGFAITRGKLSKYNVEKFFNEENINVDWKKEAYLILKKMGIPSTLKMTVVYVKSNYPHIHLGRFYKIIEDYRQSKELKLFLMVLSPYWI